ncbi:MAG TPA: fumarate reductase subunit C [Burkholderiaceae bacterium]|nr:fumarate reductase subunit C [Burkholderiaceae bacterium]
MSNGKAPARRPYMRPMRGWWRRDPFFVRYMIREATALAVLAYAIVLTVGVVRLAQGEAAFDGWLQALRSPASLLLHAVLLVSMVVHAHSWFEIMPKTMPIIVVGGRRLAASTIQRAGWAATVAVTVVVFALALWARP